MDPCAVQRRRNPHPLHGRLAFNDYADFSAQRTRCGFIPEPQDAPAALCRIGQAADTHRAGGGQITVQTLSYTVDAGSDHDSAPARR